MKLMSVVQLPEPVLDIFRQNMSVVPGTFAQAHEIEPDAVLCSIQPYKFDRKVIEELPQSVKAIATYSVGHDHIDLLAAKDRNIAVFNTPGVLGDAVADAAMLLILGAARRATESIALLREQGWPGWSPGQLIGQGLTGKTLGILGMGDIGRRVALRARAFGMNIAYHNRKPVDGEAGAYFDKPQDLIATSDVLLLAWPSTPETRHFINSETLGLAKSNMILVNIGRGDLVHDADVVAALRDNRIWGAGLDVFENEPNIAPDYLTLPNAFLTPHIGSSTWEARLAMAQILVDALKSSANGGSPENRIA